MYSRLKKMCDFALYKKLDLIWLLKNWKYHKFSSNSNAEKYKFQTLAFQNKFRKVFQLLYPILKFHLTSFYVAILDHRDAQQSSRWIDFPRLNTVFILRGNQEE